MKLAGVSEICGRGFPPIVSSPPIKHHVTPLLLRATVTNAQKRFCLAKASGLLMEVGVLFQATDTVLHIPLREAECTMSAL